ncbi:MAG TPA: YdeI/OmpD-associated family protein [Patescibacteria group bacterium]|nr:YdeI/OmpD-associated family protein [Patescibacteria group bacterium]
METFLDLPVVFCESASDWETWLAGHCTEPQGAWLKFAKKASGIQSVNYAEAVEAALCYGWIDGQSKSLDEHFYLQRFTPRRPKSIWSKVNVEKVAALTAAGKMKPSGIAAVEAAKADGRWDQAYDSPSNSTVPPDFQAALDKNPTAKKFFATLNKANSYAVLWRIQTAKKPETRQARIEKLIAMLNDEQKLHP